MDFLHIPVLLKETIDSLKINPDGIYIDGTAGGGGHSEEIAKRLKKGRLISIDQDPDAVEAATNRLEKYENVQVVKGNFSDMRAILDRLNIECVDGILLDIGVSSHQIDVAERGFSFHNDAPLDMRMSQSGISAADIVNEYSVREMAEIIFKYGEDKFADRIARGIENARKEKSIETTFELAEIVSNSVPAAAKRNGHPARQTFQALRIAVNDELGCLEKGLKEAAKCLGKDGIISVITFHSLEDRIVKNCFKEWATGCTCPKDFPVCVCGKKPFARILIKNPIVASDEELQKNPRSRSAKLRSAQRI